MIHGNLTQLGFLPANDQPALSLKFTQPHWSLVNVSTVKKSPHLKFMPEFSVNFFCGRTVTSPQAGGSGTSTLQTHVV
jgi:hypothetical protein